LPSWGEILEELRAQPQVQAGGMPDFDSVRRRYLRQLHELTGRPAIIYYSDFLRGPGPGIDLSDMQGMMECCMGLGAGPLDLLIHSPGGSAEATASIVRYLRSKFYDVRVFIPLAAMSAATMWALSANRIVMGKHSQLGPIDPQLVTPQGAVPARAIIDQFERASEECSRDPTRLGAWMPILQQYGPALLELCANAEALARRLVEDWLARYMFAGRPDAGEAAANATEFFANYALHRSHSLGIDREHARDVGVFVDDLERDSRLQDAVLSVHHASLHTLSGPCVKLIENHEGRGVYELAQQAVVQLPLQVPVPAPAPPLPPPVPPGVGPPAPEPGQS
jgi:hypothetical protein